MIVGFAAGAAGGLLTALVTAGRATASEYRVVGAVFGFVAGMTVAWLYFALFESSSIQGTPGKWLLGLRVSDLRNRRLSFRRANTRYWSKILSGLILGFGYVMAGFSERKQALHDQIAETQVTKSRYVRIRRYWRWSPELGRYGR